MARLRALPAVFRWGGALLLLGLLISVSVAGVQGEALGAAKAWFIMPLLLLVTIVASAMSVRTLVWGIVATALAQTLYGFALLPAQQEMRMIGTFSSPNFYAASVVPALFLAYGFTRREKWLVMAVLLVGILASQSLGGMVGLIAGALYVVAMASRKKKSAGIMIGIMVVMALIGGALAYKRFSNNPRSSLASRQEIWQVALRIGDQHPVTGIGLRNFDNEYLKAVPYVTTDPIEWNVPEPHNLYLAFWLDLSAVGLVAMLLIMGGALAYGGAAAVTMAVLLAHGLVDTPIFKLELAVLFWLYVTIILSRGGRSKRDLVR